MANLEQVGQNILMHSSMNMIDLLIHEKHKQREEKSEELFLEIQEERFIPYKEEEKESGSIVIIQLM